MAKSSAYQLQATGRAKRALKNVTVADGRVRAAARVLLLALAAVDTATAAVEALNETYGTTFKVGTDYTQAVGKNGLGAVARKVESLNLPTEYPPLVGEFKDENGGLALPGRAVFGEYEAPAAVKRTATDSSEAAPEDTGTDAPAESETPAKKSKTKKE